MTKKSVRRFLIASFATLVLILCLETYFRGGSVDTWEIDSSLLRAGAGQSVSIPLPASLRRSTWCDCSLRLLEDGKQVGERVSNRDLLSRLGSTSFWIDDFSKSSSSNELFFTSGDGSSPLTNGKRYILRITSPHSRFVHLPAATICLIAWACIVAGVDCLCVVSALARGMASKSRVSVRCGAVLLAAAAVFLSGSSWRVDRGTERAVDEMREFRLPAWYRDVVASGRIDLSGSGYDYRYIPACLLSVDRVLERGEFTVLGATPGLVRYSPVQENGVTEVRIQLIPPVLAKVILLCFCLAACLLTLIEFRVKPEPRQTTTATINNGDHTTPWGAYALALLFRCLLVPVVDVMAMNADFMNYASWSLTLTNAVPVHPVGVSLMAAVSRFLGVPWSVFALMLLWLSIVYLVEGLRRFVPSTGMRCVLLLLFLLSPDYLTALSLFGSETALAVATCVMLGALVRMIDLKMSLDWHRNSLFFCGGLLVWTVSRTETPLVVVTSVALGCAVTGFHLMRRNLSSVICLTSLVLPLVTVLLADSVLRVAVFRSQGLVAVAALEGPGLLRLMSVLYRIKGDESILFAPVTQKMLEEACRHSSILGMFRKELLDPTNPQTMTGASFVGKAGEPGPFLNWLLPSVFWQLGIADGDACMAAAADELESAIAEGRLAGRSAAFPIDPNYDVWLGRLPSSVLDAVFQPLQQMWVDDGLGGGRPSALTRVTFDLALGRRGWVADSSGWLWLIQGQSKQWEGWHVSLVGGEGRILAAGTFDDRGVCEPVVNSAVYGGADEVVMFLHSPDWSSKRHAMTLRLAEITGQRSSELTVDGHEIKVDIRWLNTGSSLSASRALIRRILFPAGLLTFFIAGVGVGLTRSKCRQRMLDVLPLLGAIAVWWLGRGVLVGLIDATMSWGVERYMGSYTSLAGVFCLITGIEIGAICLRSK